MKNLAWIFSTNLILSKRSTTEKLVSKKSLFKNAKTEEVFEKLKSAGVNGIELLLPINFSNTDFQQLKKVFDENNVIVNSIHQPLRLVTKTDIMEIEMLFYFAKKFNAKLIVLHLQNAKGQIFNKRYLED